MSIKNHYVYPLYVEYLKSKRMSKGAFELSKLSEEKFFDFKFRYDTDEYFKEEQEKNFKSIIREDKINDILYDKLKQDNSSR